jgi:tetratricopeptide (TPR) repeat protein
LCVAQDDAVSLFNQAQDLHEKGDLTGAIGLYDKAIEALPEFPEAEFQRANALLSLGKRADAEKGFRRSVELRPDWSPPAAALGGLLVADGKFSEAESILSKALEIDPQNSPALAALIDLRIHTHASNAVLQELLTRVAGFAAKANPTISIWTAKAALEITLKKTADARTSLEQALKLDPANRNALFQLAGLSLADGDLEKARGIAGTIESKGYTGDELFLLKAEILAQDGKGDEALKQLDAISKPTDTVVDLRKRIIASTSTSAADLEKLLANDPRNASLLGRLCTLYRRDDPAKALDYCKRANEVDPNEPANAIGFAAALVQAKQYDAAVNLLRRIIQIIPDNWTAHANLGTALFQSGRYAEAKPEFEWLISKQPNTPAAYFFLALAHDHLGEFFDASGNYQAYLKLADPVQDKLDIERVKLRLPALEKELKKGKKNE